MLKFSVRMGFNWRELLSFENDNHEAVACEKSMSRLQWFPALDDNEITKK